MPLAFSKVGSKGRTTIPYGVRQRLELKRGDTLRYRFIDADVLLDKVPSPEADDPFVAFSEWASVADEKAYRTL